MFLTARTFGISSFAFLVRSLKLKLISYRQYALLKKQADAEFAEFLKREEVKKAKQKLKEKTGGPNYFLLQVNRNSRLFTQHILDAYRGGFIEPSKASQLLNVQVNKFQKLEAQMY